MIKHWEQKSCIASTNHVNIWEVEQFPERQAFRLMISDLKWRCLFAFSRKVILRPRLPVPTNTSLYGSEVRIGTQSALCTRFMLCSLTCSLPSLPAVSHGFMRELSNMSESSWQTMKSLRSSNPSPLNPFALQSNITKPRQHVSKYVFPRLTS